MLASVERIRGVKAQRAQSRAAEQVRNPLIEAASACPSCAGYVEAQRAQGRAAEQVRNPLIEAASACPSCAGYVKAQRAQSRAAEQVRNPLIEAASACPSCAGYVEAQRAQSRAAEQVRNPLMEAASACPCCAGSLAGVSSCSCRTYRCRTCLVHRPLRHNRLPVQRSWNCRRGRRRWNILSSDGRDRSRGIERRPRRRCAGPVSRTWFRSRHKSIRK